MPSLDRGGGGGMLGGGGGIAGLRFEAFGPLLFEKLKESLAGGGEGVFSGVAGFRALAPNGFLGAVSAGGGGG